MSLTTELNNPSSPISRWFAAKYNKNIGNIVAYHNRIMSRSSILAPVDGTDFSLVGNAATYSLRKFIAAKQNNQSWVNGTLAGKITDELNISQLAQLCSQDSNSLDEEAFKMLVLGALESYYRSLKTHEIIQPFIEGRGYRKKMNVPREYISQWLPSIRDVSQIAAQLPAIWSTIESLVDVKGITISNATFGLSRLLHADCQMIIDNAILDVRTTAKRQPFTLNNFYQQLSYLLYDSDDIYKITKLVWVYTRQKVAFSYRVDQLFKDIGATRADFKQMIVENYKGSETVSREKLPHRKHVITSTHAKSLPSN